MVKVPQSNSYIKSVFPSTNKDGSTNISDHERITVHVLNKPVASIINQPAYNINDIPDVKESFAASSKYIFKDCDKVREHISREGKIFVNSIKYHDKQGKLTDDSIVYLNSVMTNAFFDVVSKAIQNSRHRRLYYLTRPLKITYDPCITRLFKECIEKKIDNPDQHAAKYKIDIDNILYQRCRSFFYGEKTCDDANCHYKYIQPPSDKETNINRNDLYYAMIDDPQFVLFGRSLQFSR